MDNKLKIKGLGSIVLKGENPEPKKEYLIAIRAEIKKIEKDIEDPENTFFTFVMQYLNTESVQEIGTSKILKVEHGKTWSQKIKWALERLADKKGIDRDVFYEQEQSRRLAQILSELDE